MTSLLRATNAFFAVASSVLFFGCNSGTPDCQSFSTAVASVTVVDGATGVPICDAAVIAALADGTTSEPFEPEGSPGSCGYGPPSDVREGVYTLAATAPGHGVAIASDFTVVSKGCGNGDDWVPVAPGPPITLTLTATPDEAAPALGDAGT